MRVDEVYQELLKVLKGIREELIKIEEAIRDTAKGGSNASIGN